jgi:hypothetical protein
MHIFDPPDSPTMPDAIRAFVAARHRWLRIWLDPARLGDPAWDTFAIAQAELVREVRARGGRWEIAGIAFEANGNNHGIALSRVAGGNAVGRR